MKSTNTRSWLGIILVVLGLLWVLDNFNIMFFNFHHIIFSWPMILIIVGILIVANSRDSVAGFILIGIGGLFLLPRIFPFGLPFFLNFSFRDIWPILLILIGLLILLRRKDTVHHQQKENDGQTGDQNFNTGGFQGETTFTQSADILDEACIFSSCRRIINSENFSGGKLTAIFGGIHLDFTNAKLNQTNAVLDVLCLFGGIESRVPPDWRVIVNVTSIFGGYEDKRYLRTDEQSKGVLVIKGTVLFGGGKIFN